MNGAWVVKRLRKRFTFCAFRDRKRAEHNEWKLQVSLSGTHEHIHEKTLKFTSCSSFFRHKRERTKVTDLAFGACLGRENIKITSNRLSSFTLKTPLGEASNYSFGSLFHNDATWGEKFCLENVWGRILNRLLLSPWSCWCSKNWSTNSEVKIFKHGKQIVPESAYLNRVESKSTETAWVKLEFHIT